MTIQNTKTSVDAYQFHKEAKANKAKLDKGDATVEKAEILNISKYQLVGEEIRSLGVTAGDYAKAAMFPTREAWLQYRADQIALHEESEGEKGAKDPRAEGQTSFQRALDIARRYHDDKNRLESLSEEWNKDKTKNEDMRTAISFLVEEWQKETESPKVNLDRFAEWCAGKGQNKAKSAPKGWDEYVREAVRKAVNAGATEDEIVSVFMDEIRTNF